MTSIDAPSYVHSAASTSARACKRTTSPRHAANFISGLRRQRLVAHVAAVSWLTPPSVTMAVCGCCSLPAASFTSSALSGCAVSGAEQPLAPASSMRLQLLLLLLLLLLMLLMLTEWGHRRVAASQASEAAGRAQHSGGGGAQAGRGRALDGGHCGPGPGASAAQLRHDWTVLGRGGKGQRLGQRGRGGGGRGAGGRNSRRRRLCGSECEREAMKGARGREADDQGGEDEE